MRKKIDYMVDNWRKARRTYLQAAMCSLIVMIIAFSAGITMKLLQHNDTYNDMVNFISWEGKLFYPNSIKELTAMCCTANDCSELADKYDNWKVMNTRLEATYSFTKIQNSTDAYYLINDLYRHHVNGNSSSALQRFIIENLYDDLRQCVSASKEESNNIQNLLNSEYKRILSDINYEDSKFPSLYVSSNILIVLGFILLGVFIFSMSSWNSLRLLVLQTDNTLASCPIRTSVKKEEA